MPYGDYPSDNIESWRRIPNANEPKIEAEPSLATKILRTQAGDLGIAPTMGLGLSMKYPGNAAKISEMMDRFLPEGPNSSNVAKAMAYIQAKYPKLSGLVRGGFHEAGAIEGKPYRSEAGSVIQGIYQPTSRRIVIRSGNDPYEKVSHTAHEMIHALQDAKGMRQGVSPFLRPSEGELSPYLRANEEVGYDANPYEIEANKGADTAADTWLRWREHELNRIPENVKQHEPFYAAPPPDKPKSWLDRFLTLIAE